MSYYQMYDALMIQKRRARQLSLLLQKERLERELQPVSDGLFHISMNREQTLKNPFMGPRLATDRATKALDMIFALPEYVDLDFRCVIANSRGLEYLDAHMLESAHGVRCKSEQQMSCRRSASGGDGAIPNPV